MSNKLIDIFLTIIVYANKSLKIIYAALTELLHPFSGPPSPSLFDPTGVSKTRDAKLARAYTTWALSIAKLVYTRAAEWGQKERNPCRTNVLSCTLTVVANRGIP